MNGWHVLNLVVLNVSGPCMVSTLCPELFTKFHVIDKVLFFTCVWYLESVWLSRPVVSHTGMPTKNVLILFWDAPCLCFCGCRGIQCGLEFLSYKCFCWRHSILHWCFLGWKEKSIQYLFCCSFHLCFKQSMLKSIHKTFDLTIERVMQHALQKWWDVLDVNCDPLSETNVSGRPCWLNSCSSKYMHWENFWPFGMSIDHYQKVMASDRASKIHMYSGS